MKKLRSLLALCCLLMLLAMCGCGGDGGDIWDTDPNGGQPGESVAATEETVADSMKVNTKYGALYYPDQWLEFVSISQSTSDDVLTVTFQAMVQDKVYTLFELTIDQERGTEVGKLIDSSGKSYSVYLRLAELELDESLSEIEKDRLYAMQEDVNFVIDHLN